MIFVNGSHVHLSDYDKIVTSSGSNYNQSQKNTRSSQYQSTNYNNIAISNTATAVTNNTIATTITTIPQSAIQQTTRNNFNRSWNNHVIYTKLKKIFNDSNTGKKPKMFFCQTCNKCFTSYSHLKRHSKTALHKNITEMFHQKAVSSTVQQSVASFNTNHFLKPTPPNLTSNRLGEICQPTINHIAQQPQSIHSSLTNVFDSRTPTFQRIKSYSNPISMTQPMANTNSCIATENSSDSNCKEQ